MANKQQEDEAVTAARAAAKAEIQQILKPTGTGAANVFNRDTVPNYNPKGEVLGLMSKLSPLPEKTVDKASRAANLTAAQAFLRKRKSEEVQQEAAKALSRAYIYCPHCEGPAIWLRNYQPGTWLSESNWESSYKSLGEPYTRHPHCQCCSIGGRRENAMVYHSGEDDPSDRRYIPMRGFVKEVSDEDFEAILSAFTSEVS